MDGMIDWINLSLGELTFCCDITGPLRCYDKNENTPYSHRQDQKSESKTRASRTMAEKSGSPQNDLWMILSDSVENYFHAATCHLTTWPFPHSELTHCDLWLLKDLLDHSCKQRQNRNEFMDQAS